MATNPTRKQVQARDILVDVVNQVVAAARLDGNTPGARIDEVVRMVASISTAFQFDEIVAAALERRAIALGFGRDIASMLTLLDSDTSPATMLRLEDEPLRERIQALIDELGDV